MHVKNFNWCDWRLQIHPLWTSLKVYTQPLGLYSVFHGDANLHF